MKSRSRRKIFTWIVCISVLFVLLGLSSTSEASDVNGLPSVQLNSTLLSGELPTVVQGFEYEEFKSEESAENLVLMTDDKQEDSLSNKEKPSKVSLLGKGKFGSNMNVPKINWGLAMPFTN